MIVAGIIQATIGVEAARRDLEDIAPRLSTAGEEIEEPGEQADPYTVAPEEGRRPAATETGTPRFAREGAPASTEDTVARNSRPTGGQS